MSRSDESKTVGTANNQNQGYYNESQNSYSQAQNDLGDYQKQLGDYAGSVGKFASANPYTQGGEFQTATNQQLSNTADAAAKAAGQTLQSQALRTGNNSAGGIAATEAMQDQNERNLGGQEAAATQSRIGSEADYNNQALKAQQGLLQAGEFPAQEEAAMAGQQGQLGQTALGTGQRAGETPSWMDEFGNSVANNLGKVLVGGKG